MRQDIKQKKSMQLHWDYKEKQRKILTFKDIIAEILKRVDDIKPQIKKQMYKMYLHITK